MKIKTSILLTTFFVLIIFFKSINYDFVELDDEIMVSQNEKIVSLSFQNIKKFFLESHYGLYHPLVLLSYALEYKFFGLNPKVYRLNNIILHLLNCYLVFWFIYLFTKKVFVSFLVSIFFATHPLHVESVVWISQRKDVLYTFFYFLSIIGYIYFLNTKNIKFYYSSLGLFLMSLLSKPMAVTLPVVLLLIDYLIYSKKDEPILKCLIKNTLAQKFYKKNSIFYEIKNFKDIFEKFVYNKLPYFVLSIIFSILTLNIHYPQKSFYHTKTTFMFEGIFNAGYGFVLYITKLFLPMNLSAIYPTFSKAVIHNKLLWFSPLILIIFVLLIFVIKNKNIIFGLSFFVITLLPVLNIFPVGLGVPADRYTYVPFVGLFYIFAQGYIFLLTKFYRYKKFLYSLIFCLIILFSYISYTRTFVWEDNYKFWVDIINKNPMEPLAYKSIGQHFVKKGDYTSAKKYFIIALRLNPRYVPAYNSLGNLYSMMGNYEEAIKCYNKALQIDPSYAKLYFDRGLLYFNNKFYNESLADYSQAIKLNPDYIEAYINRGNLYTVLNFYEQAIEDYSHALKINPNFWKIYQNRAVAYFYLGDYEKSYEDIKKLESLGYKIDEEFKLDVEKRLTKK